MAQSTIPKTRHEGTASAAHAPAPGASVRGLPASGLSASGSLDEVRQTFLGVEAELDLFSATLGGCRAWDYLRVEVFDRLIAELGLLHEKQAVPDRSLCGYLRQWCGIASSLVRRNPFRAAPAELLFVGHPRRRLEPDGAWWDPYSDPLIAGLGRSALLVERPHLHRHHEPSRTESIGRIAHLDALALAALGRRCLPGEPFPRDDADVLREAEAVLRQRFGVLLPVRGMAWAKLALRKSQLPLWRSLLRRVEPRAVFLVASYGNEVPIEACRSLGIPTVELQHGVISRQNLGYHFPIPGCEKQLFPDYLWTFGDFWRHAARFPIPLDRVVSVGYPYFEQRRESFGAAAAGESVGESAGGEAAGRGRGIVFLSQRSIGRGLSRMAVEVARACGADNEVIYQLHPGERETWRHEYPWLCDASVRVVEGDGPHLYELFGRCKLQVGVCSTALFEGLAFGLETAIARLPGHEAMHDLVSTVGAAAFVGSAEEVVAAVERASASPRETDASPFFRPEALGNARSALAAVLDAE